MQELGLKKIEQLSFLTDGTGRTLGQAAIQFILSEPSIASVLPNIYNDALLDECIAASDVPPLSSEELARVADLYASGFGLAVPAAA